MYKNIKNIICKLINDGNLKCKILIPSKLLLILLVCIMPDKVCWSNKPLEHCRCCTITGSFRCCELDLYLFQQQALQQSPESHNLWVCVCSSEKKTYKALCITLVEMWVIWEPNHKVECASSSLTLFIHPLIRPVFWVNVMTFSRSQWHNTELFMSLQNFITFRFLCNYASNLSPI